MDDYTIAVLGSHSALDLCRGAKDLGLKTLVVTQKGRGKTYSKYYKTRNSPSISLRANSSQSLEFGCVDEVLELDNFADLLHKNIQKIMNFKKSIFIPHRSFEVYLSSDYEAIEKKFKVPIFGNRLLLKTEERSVKPNQYDILKRARINFPKIFKSPKEIDRLAIVKVLQKKVSYERGFFFASSYDEFLQEGEKRLKSGLISKESLEKAVIEEFIVGTPVNFNFFYSPLDNRLELIGTDTRRQTNLDGFLRLPASQQLEVLKYLEVTFKEMGHIAVTLPESLIEDAMEAGENFVKASKAMFPPGVIGPFALQALIRPIFPKLEIVVYDVSPRMPGSPGIFATPYCGYLYGENMSMGKRIALEIKKALDSNSLDKILT
ncbi:DUF1297 domain-containing protein [Candidatus Daviesbacteria bacterium]|nr:DUF1297 domain-containing protein [Candidatus Daviesbacteria bacterium]